MNAVDSAAGLPSALLDLFHHQQRWKELFNLLGQLGIRLDILGQSGPLAVPVSCDELFRQKVKRVAVCRTVTCRNDSVLTRRGFHDFPPSEVHACVVPGSRLLLVCESHTPGGTETYKGPVRIRPNGREVAVGLKAMHCHLVDSWRTDAGI